MTDPSTPKLQAAASAGEARPCPVCDKPMAMVVRHVDCPCDAPWCSQSKREFACLACGTK